MNKMILKLIIGCGVFVFLFFLSVNASPNEACAASWTTCPGAGGVPVSSIYPGQTTVDSVELNFKITGVGIPPGQQIRIDAGAPECSEVRCLKRSDSVTATFNNTAAYANIQTIGCSTGNCNDNLQVNAYFVGGSFSGTCKVYAGDGSPDVLLPNATQSDNIKSRNGTEMSFFFYFDCTTPTTNTPTPSPTVTSTPTPTPTKVPGETPTPTPTPPPGVTYTPAPTQVCPVPETPIVSVSCIGCNGGGTVSTPTPTTSSGSNVNVTPTSGVDDGSGPTITPTSKPTPTPLPETNRKSGTACTEASQCASSVCGIRGKCF